MKLLFLGDSITEGVPGVSYVSMLQNEFSDTLLVNRGLGGDTVTSLTKRVKKMRDLASFDQIVLFIGVNDVFGKLTNTYKVLKIIKKQKWAKDISVFRTKYDELLDYILNKNENIIVIPPLLIGEDFNNFWNKELNEFIKVVYDLSKENKLPYLDINSQYKDYLKDKSISNYLPLKVYELYKDVKRLTSSDFVDQKSIERGLHLTLDGVHLNSAGARIISTSIIDFINNQK